jgi:GTPase SAR1 family protein
VHFGSQSILFTAITVCSSFCARVQYFGPVVRSNRRLLTITDIRTWHSNIEQHASAGVNKILIGNKCDWDEKRVVTLEQGRELADEFGLRFLETSAKANEGVEEAFFTLAR